VKNAYDFPGFVPAYIRPLFCEGRGPFRWVALSGEPSRHSVTDDLVLELFPGKSHSARWIELARKRIQVSGIAGAHLLAGLWRARAVWPGASTIW
jgi:urocanate hydratase